VSRNQFVLDAEVLDVSPLRRTPGGVASVALRLRHLSSQQQGDGAMDAELTIDASAFGPHAESLASIEKGRSIAVKGFLTKRSHSSDIPVFIINEFKTP
jgi:primosomal replication protein N